MMDRKGKDVLTQIFSVAGFLYSPFKDCWQCKYCPGTYSFDGIVDTETHHAFTIIEWIAGMFCSLRTSRRFKFGSGRYRQILIQSEG
jgi:hypothetical protein